MYGNIWKGGNVLLLEVGPGCMAVFSWGTTFQPFTSICTFLYVFKCPYRRSEFVKQIKFVKQI